MVSINKKAQTATLSMVLDGTKATQPIAYGVSVDNLNTAIANKAIPMPAGGFSIPIYNVTDNKYEYFRPYYNGTAYFVSLTVGKKYHLVCSYVTETAAG